jgi:molybdenum cofactor biosynthesis protein B
VSVEAVDEISDKSLPGFGEVFRRLTYERNAELALYTRAAAGVYGYSLVFAIQGSPEAVRLAVKEIILPSVKHLLGELAR